VHGIEISIAYLSKRLARNGKDGAKEAKQLSAFAD
jgi:hypothetical protein